MFVMACEGFAKFEDGIGAGMGGISAFYETAGNLKPKGAKRG
jgi:hypothetical protein